MNLDNFEYIFIVSEEQQYHILLSIGQKILYCSVFDVCGLELLAKFNIKAIFSHTLVGSIIWSVAHGAGDVSEVIKTEIEGSAALHLFFLNLD